VKSVRLLGSSGVVGLALVASACSDSPSPPAQNRPTATPNRAPTSTSTPGSTGATSSTPTTAGRGGPVGPSPTLGVASAWGASAVGFGRVQPAEISLGGDPTGVLAGITWQSWGGATATGTGTSTYVGPNQSTAQGTPERATVVASDLGTCGGGAAYQQVKWYFPDQGETLSTGTNTTINACSGP